MTEPRQPQSQLAPIAHLCREPGADDGWRIAEQAWHTHGMIVVRPAEVEKRRGYIAGKQAAQLGEVCFGKRRAKA